MADRLRRGLEHLNRRLKSHASQSVVYSRGAATVTLLAVRSRTKYQADSNGTVIEFEAADWLIDAADLVLSGSLTKPQSGDRVTYDGQVYEVAPPHDAAQCFDACDPHELRLRIHSQQIES